MNLHDYMLQIGSLLHERMMHHSETARTAGLDELANDIEQTKLDLANHIFIVTLMMQMNTTSLEDK